MSASEKGESRPAASSCLLMASSCSLACLAALRFERRPALALCSSATLDSHSCHVLNERDACASAFPLMPPTSALHCSHSASVTSGAGVTPSACLSMAASWIFAYSSPIDLMTSPSRAPLSAPADCTTAGLEMRSVARTSAWACTVWGPFGASGSRSACSWSGTSSCRRPKSACGDGSARPSCSFGTSLAAALSPSSISPTSRRTMLALSWSSDTSSSSPSSSSSSSPSPSSSSDSSPPSPPIAVGSCSGVGRVSVTAPMRTSSKSGRDAHTQMAWLSTCAVQRNSPPGETVIDVAAYSNEYQPMSAPDGTSTTRSVQSSADERTQRASAPHATSVSVFVCPSSRRTSRSATASITRTERSSAARATRVESRLWRSMPHAHPTSAVDCSLRAAGAHRRSVPSPPQEKRVRPSAAAARPRTAPSCRSSAAAAAAAAAIAALESNNSEQISSVSVSRMT
mmetsp:Transcript_6434/g.21517  ORF Transcript_6434/g.21517 Transcript_6434/m.21517 type:complete len:457 (-) Transcript_6434:1206-2576(-)